MTESSLGEPRRGRWFATPASAALEGWRSTPGVRVRVVSVQVRGDRAEVVLATDGGYEDFVYCVERDGQWTEVVSGNAPTSGWSDPDELAWDWIVDRGRE